MEMVNSEHYCGYAVLNLYYLSEMVVVVIMKVWDFLIQE
jgi:hypothetical protein